MTDKVIENNQVTIMGEIVSSFTYSHEIFGEGFYMVDVKVQRLSDSFDVIPMMVSERLLDINANYIGYHVEVSGQFRSYNRHEERKNRLVLSVFAREISFVDEIEESAKTNQIFLDGYICKPPVYRKTLSAEKLPTCFWQSTVLTASPITFRASAGEEMPGLPTALKWGTNVVYGAESRAAST